MNSPRRLFIPLLVLACTVTARAHDFRMSATATYADNFSRTSNLPTQQSTSLWDLDGSFTHAWQLAPNWTLIGSLEGNAERVADFSTMDRLTGTARATVRHKFGLGPMVPVLDVGGALSSVNFREHGRSGWRAEGFARLTQRLTDYWRVGLTANMESFSAAHSTFDTHAHQVGLETYVTPDDRWQFGLGTARLYGQVVANAAPAVWQKAINGDFGSAIYDYYNVIASETSNTFGPGWVAYRVDCRADFWWAEISYELNAHTRIPLRLDKVIVDNRVGVRYIIKYWSIGILHSF